MPFAPEELLARSIVITRRVLGTDRPIVPTIRLGEIEIDILNRQVTAGDSVVHLSGIEQSLLYLLASRGGQVVTRDEILDAIWGTDFVAESNIVDRHIRSLRIKLQNDYRHPRFIATVPGKGYRFIPTFSNMGWDGQRAAGERTPH
jgi:two-component system alkaline phosphatase synthesis response regulator PhoP